MESLISKFSKKVRYITTYYKKLINKIKTNESIGGINEWVVDNYYIISEQVNYIVDSYNYKEMMKIKKKRKEQIYSLVYNILKVNDFQININTLYNGLNTYQTETKDYFSYYETNLIYIFIRMALIIELGDLCERLEYRLDEKHEIDQMFENISNNITKNGVVDLDEYININDYIKKNPYYIEEISLKLTELGVLADDVFTKFNESIEKNDTTLRKIIEKSQTDLAFDNFLIINLFTSLKKIVKYRHEDFYKNINFAERMLISEDENIYYQIYENNKAEYRGQVIKNAKEAKMSEYEYASLVINKANNEGKHVGWYLFKNKNYLNRVWIYIATITVLTVLLSLSISFYTDFLFFIILLIPISVLVIDIICQLLMRFDKVNSLFKLKFENGIPENLSTMVVLTNLLNSGKKVEELFGKLEVYYLSSMTDNLYFTLIADCTGEATKDAPHDEKVIEAGLRKTAELNEKYGKEIFYFVYRSRVYSKSENMYMGFERKRGALSQFNKLLLNKLNEETKNNYFSAHTFHNFNIPIKYVIPIDVDTKLVLNTALKMVGAMAHPMNRPVLSEDHKKVVSGYGIMQPRINIDVEVTSKSQYSQLFAGLGGLDTYVTASFDLYQDIFNEGSFVGKGIYDLEVFEEVLSDAFPNNLILSHDLLEGNYLRCGFINDVELFDDFPSNYLSDVRRHHRWNRGDWQIISWLKKKIKNKKGQKVNNPLNILNKWKIFDNLRRSLVNPFLLLIILYGFTIGVGSASNYLILVCGIISIPIFFYLISQILYRNSYDIFLKYYLNLVKGILAVVNRSFIALAILPHEAYIYLDSCVKSLYRMFVSHRKLLEWITAEEAERTSKNDLASYIKKFGINYLTSIVLIGLTYIFKPNDLEVASLLSIIWFLAPFLMYIIGRKIADKDCQLNDSEIGELKEISIKTWHYFDDLLTEENNYLISDNFQLNREEKVDGKTSPTDIGFSLVSVVSAYELGLISIGKTMNLLTNIVMSVERLEMWQGHLYNWYDIHSLNKLYPHFISSVDNGNFIACLYVAKGFLEKQGDKQLLYRVKRLIDNMNLKDLYNKDSDVFSVGYKVDEELLLPFNYNNFASESRLTSFIAISKNDVPQKHWFCLDKTLTKYKYYKGVASWAGTAFEYFMPLIFMKTYNHTLLDETYYFAYYAQREFVKEVDPELPWGISESSYSKLDDLENYCYSSFGIPYLKFQESTSYPIVISPYSSIMAISVDDKEVYRNMQKLKNLNMYDIYGFFDAYDNEEKVVVKNYYAHHQGMILASLTNYLKDNVIQEYFHSDKNIESIEMLLKEKVQIRPYIDIKMAKYKKYHYVKEHQENDIREYHGISNIPEIGCLSNGYYSIVIDDKGDSFSKYNNLQMNRYRKISDNDYGIFLYIKNLNNNRVWSNTYAPLNIKPDSYKAVFACDRIKYVREDDGIVTNTEITVTKDHNAELRKITFQNRTDKDVELEITSYSEVIIRKPEEEIAHPVFNDITINSELDEATSSLLFSRKSRTKDNITYFLIGRMFTDDEDDSSCQYETSKARFVGRNNTLSHPDAIYKDKTLSNKVESSLDSVMGIRKKIKIKANSKKHLYLLVGFGKSREQVMEIVDTYKDDFSIDKAFDMATVLSNIRNKHSNITTTLMNTCNKILKCFFVPFSNTMERENLLYENSETKKAFWEFGISGDVPIMLTQIDDINDITFIKETLQVYEFFKARALGIDFIIIDNTNSNDVEQIHNYVNNYLYHINNLNEFNRIPGNVFVLQSSKIREEVRRLFDIVSIISFNASNGKILEQQVDDIIYNVKYISKKEYESLPFIKTELPDNINCYNNFGGFINNGEEYLINNLKTPMPWSNVIANEKFGCVVTNNFGGFTYAYNSREFKLTAWSNDPASDSNSEKIIINNCLFKPSIVKHGFGYTTFFNQNDDYDVFVKVFVDKDDTIKFYEMNITNNLKTKQFLKIDFSLKMVLGVTEEDTNRYLITNFDKELNRLYVKNKYINKFQNTNVFLSSTEKIDEYEEDIVNKTITINLDLKAKESKVFSFMLGCEEEDNALTKYNTNEVISKSFQNVNSYWQSLLSPIKIKTPDETLNYALNGWYLYQVYASRLYAKTAFYQVGGAIGFRDQLQDIMGLMVTNQDYARKQIITHASHQFKEGDVLHWWHEDILFGSRTRFSDDYLWLVYVVYDYLKITDDYTILDEMVPYVEAKELDECETEKGVNYTYSSNSDTLYEHLKLCISKSINRLGEHGLPLMGSGDWNDGMNKVGYRGEGESVFVSFFLYDLLLKMSDISKKKDDDKFSDICLDKRNKLETSINKNTWDGEWYLRAYFDNGEPLGSRNNTECKIDLVSQVWSVLSGIAPSDKKKKLFDNVEKYLVDKDNKIIKLLTPAFDHPKNNPGYIKDYNVGIRENGGQYTHAALWYIMALLKEKQIDKAYDYYQMINPINRTLTEDDTLKYKVEPYVIAADIYSNANHVGRGGWTWYTGSASWAYKIGIEEILGFKKEGNKLRIDPKIKVSWDNYEITYRYLDTQYIITVNNKDHVSNGIVEISIDGKELKDNYINLVDDKKIHKVTVNIRE